MPDEARLEDVGTGLAPVTPGWFVVQRGRRGLGAQHGPGQPLRVREQRARAAAADGRRRRSASTRSASRSRCSSPASPRACTTRSRRRRTSSSSAASACWSSRSEERRLRAVGLRALPGRHEPRPRRRRRRPVHHPDARRAPRRADDRATRAPKPHSPTAPASRPRPTRPAGPTPRCRRGGWSARRRGRSCRGRERRGGADGGVQLRAAPRRGVGRTAASCRCATAWPASGGRARRSGCRPRSPPTGCG